MISRPICSKITSIEINLVMIHQHRHHVRLTSKSTVDTSQTFPIDCKFGDGYTDYGECINNPTISTARFAETHANRQLDCTASTSSTAMRPYRRSSWHRPRPRLHVGLQTVTVRYHRDLVAPENIIDENMVHTFSDGLWEWLIINYDL